MTTVQFDGTWLGGEGRLTPEELQTVTFPVSRLGRRGYEEEPVRAFLRVVHGEFVRLVNERSSLWQEVQACTGSGCRNPGLLPAWGL